MCTRIYLNGDVIWIDPDSAIGENFACGIRNPGLWNPEFSSRNLESHWRLESRIPVPLTKTETQRLDSLRDKHLKEEEIVKWGFRAPFPFPSLPFPFSFKSRLVQWNPTLRSPRYYGHFFWPSDKNRHTFSCNKRPSYGHPINTANFSWPIGDRINGVPLYPESEIDRVESRIQGCLGFLSWF